MPSASNPTLPSATLTLGPSALPVYDTINNHTVTYWASNRSAYQNSNGLDHDPTPLRVLKLDDYSVGVQFQSVPWPASLPASQTTVTLQGYLEMEGGVEQNPCTDSAVISINYQNGQIQDFNQTLNLLPARNVLPWGIRGSILWTLTLAPSFDSEIRIAASNIEIYFIAQNATFPDYLYRGLPKSFFRRFILPLRLMTPDKDIGSFVDVSKHRIIEDAESGWLTWVIEKLHFQRQIRYDSLGSGSCHYFWGNSGPLKFDYWVADCDDNEVHPINCYDLAGLAQVILPLGFRTDDYYVRMKIMSPYGYINETNLIGWGKTNSPMGPVRNKALNDVSRTGFGRHVFLTLARTQTTDVNGTLEKVLDATTRPLDTAPHAGWETLEQYATSAIDQTTTLYNMDSSLFGKYKNCQEVKGSVNSSEPNPRNWPGVNKLTTLPEIYYTGALNGKTGEANVLSGVPPIFQNYWKVNDPDFGPGDQLLSATWFLTPNSSTDPDEYLNLRISRCASTNIAHQEFNQTKQRLTDENTVTLSTTLPGAPQALQTAWSNMGHFGYFIEEGMVSLLWTDNAWVIEMSGETSNDVTQYVSAIGDLIENLNKNAAPSQSQLTVEGESDALWEMTVGQEIAVTISGQDQALINIVFDGPNVLYMGSTSQANSFVCNFLARAPTTPGTPDTIKFSTYSGSMDVVWSSPIQVIVTAPN